MVAVTGLSGHAYGSWRNRANGRMWLEDFLPKHFQTNIRILTYGYNSSLKMAGQHSLLEYSRSFIQDLTNARASLLVRRPMVDIEINGDDSSDVTSYTGEIEAHHLHRPQLWLHRDHAGKNVPSRVRR